MQKLTKLLLISALAWVISGQVNLWAQTPAWIYADSMMLTPIGDSMYDYFMTLPSDFTDSTELTINAYAGAMDYFIGTWYRDFGFITCEPTLEPADTTCHNYHWELSEQSDTILVGWELWDQRRGMIAACNTEDVNWKPLPLESRPTVSENSSPEYRFNLDPNDNGSITLLSTTLRVLANFLSFELYEDEPDVIIPHLISSTPPSGNRSIRINNEHDRFHINSMRRQFEVEEENATYYYSYAFVMEDPNDTAHGPTLNPFFRVVIYDDSCNVLEERCTIANINDEDVDVIHLSGYSPIVYKRWTCDSFQLKEYIGDTITIEFIAADCGLGAHFGYAYVADICDDCSCMPHISFNENETECGIPDLCGVLTFCDDYEFVDMELEVTQESEIYLSGGDYNYDPATGEFCFDVDTSFFSGLDDGGYDIYAVAYLINPSGDTITVRTLTVNPNSVDSVDNDIFIPIEICCPDTLNFIWLADLDNMTCIDAGSSGEKIISMEFVLYLPEGYVDCDNEPVFEDGYFDYTDYTYSATTNTIHISGEYHIDDISGFDEDYVVRGYIDLCQEEDTSTVCPATFEIAKIDCHSNCSEDPCAEGVECDATLDVTYVDSGWTYLTLCVNLLELSGECDYGDYDLYVYDEYGVVLSHSVIAGRVDRNGVYCVEIEYETELEEICFDIVVYNDCTELDYCESTICVENEAFWGGGNIERRSSDIQKNHFRVVPNPVSTDEITIISSNPTINQATLSLFASDGHIIMAGRPLDLTTGRGRLDISLLNQGYYYMKVTTIGSVVSDQYIPFVIIK